MQLNLLDGSIIIGSMLISVLIGVYSGRKSGKSAEEFFLSGRTMSGGLLGISMVATTFSTDTPNLVTGLTRTYGIAGNWLWWAFLLTCMLTAFFFAHLWRRSGVTTDMEFYELRYSGKPAAFLRAFRGLYVGVLVNVLIMGAVTLAAVKFGSVLFGVTPMQCILAAGTATLIFATIGGFRGVVFSDAYLFVLAMTGSIAAAVFAVNHPDVGGLQALFSNPELQGKTDFIPALTDPSVFVTLMVMPLLVQWWSVWYPGAEPGGGGFVAQRLLAAKNENQSVWAMLLFNVAHYALRPWPWILVALASLVVFPDVQSLRTSFPEVDPNVISDDFAYAAMLTFIPSGWIGIVAAALLAAYISTAGTGLNLGASYIVNDVYQRFLRPSASQREVVLAGRIATVAMMVMIGATALLLESATQAFGILISIGAGTGLLFILRWYWPRINAWSEISAMVIAFATSMFMQLSPHAAVLPDWAKLLGAVSLTTAGWIMVTLLTPRTAPEVLRSFYLRVRPPGPAWRSVAREMGLDASHAQESSRIGAAFGCVVTSCAGVYALLFCVGALLRGDPWLCIGLALVAAVAGYSCYRGWRSVMSKAAADAAPAARRSQAVASQIA